MGRLARLVVLAGALSVAAAPLTAHDKSTGAAPIPARAQSFEAWLGDLRAEAEAAGIGESTLDAALDGLSPIPRVIELDRQQPEVTQTFDEYMALRVTPELVEEGRRVFREQRALLTDIGGKYRVQPRFIVALWGVETRYGKYTGGFPVIAALATLAYDGRRSAYFRGELLDAL